MRRRLAVTATCVALSASFGGAPIIASAAGSGSDATASQRPPKTKPDKGDKPTKPDKDQIRKCAKLQGKYKKAIKKGKTKKANKIAKKISKRC